MYQGKMKKQTEKINKKFDAGGEMMNVGMINECFSQRPHLVSLQCIKENEMKVPQTIETRNVAYMSCLGL